MTSNELAELSIHHGALQKHSELFTLLEFLNSREQPKTVVEIGTARGGTLWLWCKVSDEAAKIISIDLPFGQFGGGYSEDDEQNFTAYKKPNQELFFIRNDSHLDETEETLQKILDGVQIDLLFIDGDHTLSGVTDDYYRYKKYVSSDGIIVFHDIIEHPQVPECEVHKFWENHKNDSSISIIEDEFDDRGWGPWGGIGILKAQ